MLTEDNLNNETLDAMKQQIIQNKLQYQKLVDSGMIKDKKKKEAMMVLIG